ncbi:DUF1254 domain-containing protein [Rhizobium laguerreae]|uniref:DUF1254 domain-containing protein n=1 Tax=Rhizobium laguerreae TaxID=1076926 RepID=UPI001C91460C|nr:DUF1254 domain-containing protein [Rhizobium laguerreae]MBY3232710.1 DUF1254 domain-containing protein [Rhizobium laguerreae]
MQANKRDWGVDYNDVSLVDGYTTPAVGALTGNNTTIYAAVFTDLERDGPVVIDSPVGVYGVIDDFWQRPMVEVGPFGPDKGKGGKFLLLPPGYDGPVPDGYLATKSKTNQTMFIGRAFVNDGDIKTAVDTLARIKAYPLSKAGNPPETRIVHAGDRPLNSIPPKGFDYWKLVADALDKEPVEDRDRFFHAMLKPLGIEKGKTFKPDARQKKILTETMKVGVSSQDKLKENADGSVDIHFGPKVPKDDVNWVRTIPGRGWFAYFRWYGPTEKFFDKSWTLPDIDRKG